MALTINELEKGYVRNYRLNARVQGSLIEIRAVYRSRNRVKARYVGGRGEFMIDLNILEQHGGAIEE